MSDKNYISYVRENNPDLSEFVNPFIPSDYSDTMKFSNCSNVLIKDKTIEGGNENCIDAVRGKNYEINGCVLNCHGTSAVVYKGGINGWKILNSIINPKGVTDIEIGQFDNYYYFGRPKTINGKLEKNKTTTGAKVRCKCWQADIPQYDDNLVITKVTWIIWQPYFLFMYLYVRITGIVPWVWVYDPPQTPTKNGIPQ